MMVRCSGAAQSTAGGWATVRSTTSRSATHPSCTRPRSLRRNRSAFTGEQRSIGRRTGAGRPGQRTGRGKGAAAGAVRGTVDRADQHPRRAQGARHRARLHAGRSAGPGFDDPSQRHALHALCYAIASLREPVSARPLIPIAVAGSPAAGRNCSAPPLTRPNRFTRLQRASISTSALMASKSAGLRVTSAAPRWCAVAAIMRSATLVRERCPAACATP